MRIPRLFIEQTLRVGENIMLPKDTRQYVERVLRLKAAHPLILFNGQGGQYSAALAEGGRAQILGFDDTEHESPLSIHLVQGISKGERMDVTLQKATELGATRITPVGCERSVVRLDEERAERRRERWQQIVRSACEQCGRNRVPEVDEPQTLKQFFSTHGDTDVTRIILAPDATHSLQHIPPPRALCVLVGPEGGLSTEEIEQAKAHGFIAVRLGQRILRTETAGLAVLAAAQTLWGDFSG